MWKTLTLTFERERTVYLEIVDRSRQGHIVVHDVVFDDSKEPPATDPFSRQSKRLAHKEQQTGRTARRERPRSSRRCPTRSSQPSQKTTSLMMFASTSAAIIRTLALSFPRRSLSCVAGSKNTAAGPDSSGRLLLAEKMASPDNPLVARVMVNRIWKHHFGQGLVKSTDNFGKMGEALRIRSCSTTSRAGSSRTAGRSRSCTGMMLLTRMPTQMSSAAESGGRRRSIRRTSCCSTFRCSDWKPRRSATRCWPSRALDPDDRRPERAALHQPVSGRPRQAGRRARSTGRPRSIYIRRAAELPDADVLAFDIRCRSSTIGRRSVSTVPSQAMILMNNAFVALEGGPSGRRPACGERSRRAAHDGDVRGAFAPSRRLRKS